MTDKPAIKSGVVTFLDVIGWKGIYNRKDDAIEILAALVRGVRERVEKRHLGSALEMTEVLSLSDTIAIFTTSSLEEVSTVINIHGEVCQWLVYQSILREIPIRGATAFGEFEKQDNIFVGKAVDEAASWHEEADWIGVHLTPSAEFVFHDKSANEVWVTYPVPCKTRIKWEPHCVNWTVQWGNKDWPVEIVKRKFRQLGPIVPEITSKFINTLSFIEEVWKPKKTSKEK